MNSKLRAVLPAILYPLCRLRERLPWRNRLRILTYHRVNADLPDDRLTVHPDAFRYQLNELKLMGRRTIGMAEYFRMRRDGGDLRPCVLLTFDDGYADNLEVAVPILRDFGFSATFFVVTGMLGTDRVMTRYHGKPGNHRMLRWDEAHALQDAGMEIGAHSVSHLRLDRVMAEEAAQEIAHSAEALRGRGFSADWFCYPSGGHTREVIDLVRISGFRGALTTKPGTNTLHTNSYGLRRTEISGMDSIDDFRKKVAGAFDLQHSFTYRMALR